MLALKLEMVIHYGHNFKQKNTPLQPRFCPAMILSAPLVALLTGNCRPAPIYLTAKNAKIAENRDRAVPAIPLAERSLQANLRISNL